MTYKIINVQHVVLAVWIILAFALDKRSLTVGCGVLFLLNVLKIKQLKKNYLKVVFAIACFFIFTGLISFFHKSDSSLGRILIYKITATMIKDIEVFGIGFGHFKANYLFYQAKYFQSHEISTTKEVLLADNTYYLFNDYLQFVIELGILGVLIITLFLIIVLTLAKLFSSGRLTLAEEISFTILMPIIISAFFNHMFDRIVVQILFVFSVPNFNKARI